MWSGIQPHEPGTCVHQPSTYTCTSTYDPAHTPATIACTFSNRKRRVGSVAATDYKVFSTSSAEAHALCAGGGKRAHSKKRRRHMALRRTTGRTECMFLLPHWVRGIFQCESSACPCPCQDTFTADRTWRLEGQENKNATTSTHQNNDTIPQKTF